MINKTTISPSQSSHGGTLFYVYKIPEEEYNCKKIEKNVFRYTIRNGAVFWKTNLISQPFFFMSSTDSGWDNPFRPDGDLSREADEIVNLIKGI